MSTTPRGLSTDKAEQTAEAVKAGLAKMQPIPRAGLTDDIAVLTTAIALINRHIKDRHYDEADKALADDVQPT